MATPYSESGPPSGAPGGKTSLGLDSNLGAMLCYIVNIVNILCGIGIILSVILSIVFLITEKENRFVKFHASQALLLDAGFVVLLIVVEIFHAILGILNLELLGLLLWLITWGLRIIVFLIFMGLCILAGIKAYGGQWYKLPLIGNFAWNAVNK
jgi:uncharacterized membrane protein